MGFMRLPGIPSDNKRKWMQWLKGIRHAGTGPMCIGLHLLLDDSQAAHTEGGQQMHILLWPAHRGRSERSEGIRVTIKIKIEK